MNDVLDAIIFYDDLSAEQQEALLAALEVNPQLAESFNKWRKLQHKVQSSLSTQIPNREVLVLHALAQDDPDLLTASEHQTLANASAGLEEAFRRHPALQDVLKDIQSAQTDFLSLWENLTWKDLAAPSVHQESINTPAPDRAPAARLSRRTVLYRITAAILLLAITTTAGILSWRSQNLEIVKTTAGEFRVVELIDGSTVRLYGKSKISYTSHSDQFAENRSVELNGQAFFDIAPNTSPFIVHTATALTEATGTKFSIEANRSLTKVILTAGQVALSSRQRKGNVRLSPGEMSMVRRRQQPSTPEPINDLTEVLGWTGLLVFHDTPIDEVAAHLSAYYGVSVSVDPQLINEHWVATYDPDTLSVTQILDNLATTLGAVVQSTGENAYLLTK